MFGGENAWSWIVAHVLALLPEDWRSSAGEAFRESTQAVSQFAQANGLMAENLLEEGIELGRRKVTGLASKEHAEAERNYAQATKVFTEIEDQKIETALKTRALESDVQKREADARAAVAAADLAEIQVFRAKVELFKEFGPELDLLNRTLEENGMLLHRNEKGNLIIFPRPKVTARLLDTNPESEQE
jgi:hypothetical protein